MPKEFIMRGKTASGQQDLLQFGNQARPGYGYRLKELRIYPTQAIGAANFEGCLSITADNIATNPQDPNFDDDGLIATALFMQSDTVGRGGQSQHEVVNDLFVITQDLILMVFEINGEAINWQCKFEEIKLSSAAEAVANFKQYTVYNTG